MMKKKGTDCMLYCFTAMTDIEWLELSPAELESLSDADKLNYRQKILDELSEQVVGYLEEDDIASIANFDDSDVEDIEIPQYDYDETDDEDFEEENEVENAPESYTARDGTIWTTQPPPLRKILMHNVIKDTGFPTIYWSVPMIF